MTFPDYRQRAYQSYLTTQVRPDSDAILNTIQARLPYLRHMIKRWVPLDRNISILDIGCGHGALIYALHQAGYKNLSGIDGSPEQVEAAHKLGLSQVQEGDFLSKLEFTPASSIDMVIAYDVLEHQSKDEVVQFMDHVFRILRSGGRLLVHVPNGEGILGGRMRYADITHELAFTAQSLRQIGSLAGFSSSHFEEDRPVVHGLKSAIRWVLWMFLRIPFCLIRMAETGELGRNSILTQNILAVFVR